MEAALKNANGAPARPDKPEALLSVRGLHTSFFTHRGEMKAVRGVDLDIAPGEIVGIVGESGSGKSVTARSIMGILSPPGRLVSGSVRFKGRELVGLAESELRKIRGAEMSMIFQDPMTFLNPVFTVGDQVTEAILAHRRISKMEAEARALGLFEAVRIPSAAERFRAYPHEFSGGMRQRVVIAMALACEPDLIFADEPTTALDVTIQEQILSLLGEAARERGAAIALITHDLGVVAQLCSRVVVMYGGMIMEEGSREDIFYRSAHPYTRGLLASVPGLARDKARRLEPIPGSPPNLAALPIGCPFAPRCPEARRICAAALPPRADLGGGRRSLCWLHHPDAPKEA